LLLFIHCDKDYSTLEYFEEGYHTVRGVWSLGPEAVPYYKFKNMPRICGFVDHFPADSILAEVAERPGQDIEVTYWICTCVADAELRMVERLDMSSGLKLNMIDYPIPGGPIGDNCYYMLNSRVILFIRNNVYVDVERRQIDLPTTWDEIEDVARRIDAAIQAAPKVASGSQVPAPIIHSVEVISQLPREWDEMLTVKITATDARYDSLTYRIVGSGMALNFFDGIERFTLVGNYAPLFWSDDPNKFRVVAWVWNEAHFVALAEAEFPFRK
jgi:hypothetical protein